MPRFDLGGGSSPRSGGGSDKSKKIKLAVGGGILLVALVLIGVNLFGPDPASRDAAEAPPLPPPTADGQPVSEDNPPVRGPVRVAPG